MHRRDRDGAGKGGVRKAIPVAPCISSPTLEAPISAGGGECPSRGHLCPSVPPGRPLSLLEDPFWCWDVAVPGGRRRGWMGPRGRVTSSPAEPSSSFPHALLLGANQRWHLCPCREIPVPTVVAHSGVTAGESVPRQLTALPALQTGVRFGAGRAAQAGDRLGGRVPKGRRARAPLRCHPGARHKAGHRQGEPRSCFTTWLSPLPPRAHGDPQDGPQERTSPLSGSSGRGAGASLPAPHQAAPSDPPVRSLGRIFSLRRAHRGC